MQKLILVTLAIGSANVATAQTQPTAVAAAPAATVAPTPAAAPAPGRPKTICKSEDSMGSRLGSHKVCHTAAEWQAINRYEQDNMDERLRRPHQEAAGG